MNKILVLCLLILSSTAFADTKFSIGGGVNFTTANVEGSLGDFENEVAADLAVAGKVEIGINEQWLLRTGLWLQEKTIEISLDKGGVEGTIQGNTIYASIPLNLQYKAHESVSVFGGYIADLRINDYCDTDGDFNECAFEKDSESVVHVATAGISVIVNEKLNIDVSWQQGLTDVMEDAYKLHTLQVMGFYKF